MNSRLVTENYYDWFKNSSEEDQASALYHGIYSCSKCSFLHRVMIAFMIICGGKVTWYMLHEEKKKLDKVKLEVTIDSPPKNELAI